MANQLSGKIVIEKGVKLHVASNPSSNKGTSKYPFKEMEIGDSFFAPIAIDAISSTVARAKKNTGFQFALRQVEGGTRCWRVNPKGEESFVVTPKPIAKASGVKTKFEKSAPIVKTAPDAKVQYPKAVSKYPFEEMDIGESFFAPVHRNVLLASARYWSAKLRFQFTILHEKKGSRCFRVS